MNTEDLTQMRHDLTNLYLIAMRGDNKVRISYAGPAPRDETSAPDLTEYFADLAEEAGLSDTAEALIEQASKPKTKAKRTKKGA